MTDLDVTDVVDTTVTSVVVTGTGSGSVPGTLTNPAILAYLSFTGGTDVDNAATPGSTNNLSWSWNSGAEAFNFLPDGQTLILTYTVTATDDDGLTDTQTVVITITGSNDAPVLDLNTTTLGINNTATFDWGVTASVNFTAGAANLSDVDNANFDSISISYTTANFQNEAGEQLLIAGATVGGTISNLNMLSGTGTFTLGGVIYDYSVGAAAGTTTITVTGDAAAELTQAQAEAFLDALQYRNVTAVPTIGANRIFTVIATDAQGTAAPAATFTVDVTANQAPVINNQAFLVIGSTAIVGTDVGNVIATDDSGILTYTITAGNTANNNFSITNAGLLEVANLTGLTGTFSLTVEVADDGTPQKTASATITVLVISALTLDADDIGSTGETDPNASPASSYAVDGTGVYNDASTVVTFKLDPSGAAYATTENPGAGTYTASNVDVSLNALITGAINKDTRFDWDGTDYVNDTATVTVTAYETVTVGGVTSAPISVTDQVELDVEALALTVSAPSSITAANAWSVAISGDKAEAGAIVTLQVYASTDTGFTIPLTFKDQTGTSTTALALAAQVGNSGDWSANINLAGLVDGSYVVVATQLDTFGNISTAVASGVIAKDTALPYVESLGNITTTHANSYRLSGYAHPGAAVLIKVGNKTVTVTADADTGAFTTGSLLYSGLNNVVILLATSGVAVEVSQSGGTVTGSTIKFTTTINKTNTTAGGSVVAPVIAPVPTNITALNKAAYTLTGTGVSGDTVTVIFNNGSGTVVASAVVSGGTWSMTVNLSSLASANVTALAYQRDPTTYNQSAASASRTITWASNDVAPIDVEEALNDDLMQYWAKAEAKTLEGDELTWVDFTGASLSETLEAEFNAFGQV